MTYSQVWDAMQNKPSDKMIQRDADQAFIPFDDANVDYQEYKEWLAKGNKPTPYKSPESVTVTTTRTVTKGNK